jgi:hypothetical protein
MKPELITDDFSMQIFLQKCYLANVRTSGFGNRACWANPGTCQPCTYTKQVNTSNMKPHP